MGKYDSGGTVASQEGQQQQGSKWRTAASSAYPLLVAAAVMHFLAFILLVVSVAIDWWSFSANATADLSSAGLGVLSGDVKAGIGATRMYATGTACNTGYYGSGCRQVTYSYPSLAVEGGAVAIFGMIFTLISAIICAAAASKLRTLVKGGAEPSAPAAGTGCVCGCYPSIPAIINGTAWTGFVFILLGLIIVGAILSFLQYLSGESAPCCLLLIVNITPYPCDVISESLSDVDLRAASYIVFIVSNIKPAVDGHLSRLGCTS